ncbi:Winged helix DNA-binding domain-containing protein [Microlunatus sagamiharensis]|uniref:Winged helix DNA-binding domain-containing protein n=1 Tax=Microlunatus sagamiharensis TaxID=546874 RepID=A0A1H2M737_9ACTN|nr:winged helix DNA-binding domain-containing protein [Microlunatus sagamiharensis]SDU88969.1 Winged helix DNA-binding domain-containing protein [Microlunatus sagamiharensis]
MAGADEVREQRLLAQGLGVPAHRRPVGAVRLLLAVQSQELAHACWSLALRSDATTEDEVRAPLDAGDVVRTHVLRPTWHLVAAEDVRWLLATTAARVHQANASIYRAQGLDAAVRDRGAAALAAALADGTPRTRLELAAVLADAGLPSAGVALASLVMHAELEQVVVSGPARGAAQTHVLMDDRVPHGAADDADPVRLLRRFFAGHGPASVRDVARWSSLTLAVVRAALAEVRDELAEVEVAGETYFSVPDGPAATSAAVPTVLLLPLYDELPRSYRDLAHPRPPDHPHPPGADRFVGSVVAGGADLGTWRREVRGRVVEVALDLAPSTPEEVRAGAEEQARRLAAFLGRELERR